MALFEPEIMMHPTCSTLSYIPCSFTVETEATGMRIPLMWPLATRQTQQTVHIAKPTVYVGYDLSYFLCSANLAKAASTVYMGIY